MFASAARYCGRFDRIGLRHRLSDDVHAIVQGSAIGQRVGMKALLVVRFEAAAFRRLIENGAALRAIYARVDRLAAKFPQFGIAHRVAAKQVAVHREALHLLAQCASLSVVAAVENPFGVRALDVRQDRHEVGRLVGRVLTIDDLDAVGFGRADELVGDALAVRSAIVDHGDTLDLQFLCRKFPHPAAKLRIAGGDSKHERIAVLRDLRIGRDGRHHDARHVHEVRDRNRDARIERPENDLDVRVDQALCDRHAGTRVGGVILRDQFKARLLAADHETFGIQALDRHSHAVLVVLADGGLRAGQRPRQADPDDLLAGLRAQGNHAQSDGCPPACTCVRLVHHALLTSCGVPDRGTGNLVWPRPPRRFFRSPGQWG